MLGESGRVFTVLGAWRREGWKYAVGVISVPASHGRCQSVWNQLVWDIRTRLPPALSVGVGYLYLLLPASSVGVGYPYWPPTRIISRCGLPVPAFHQRHLLGGRDALP